MQNTARAIPLRPRIRLMENTQFVYELHLAALEIAALVGEADMSGDMREFFPPAHADTDSLLRCAAYVADVNGVESDYAKLVRHNVMRSMNQYITHWFYPYKGKFHPQMIRALANIIGLRENEVLLDPFVGSGTTAVECALLGIKTIGFDISPLCVLISKTKTNAVHHFAKLEAMPEPMLEAKTPEIDVSRALKDPLMGFDLLARLIANSDHVRRRRNFATQLQKNFHQMKESIRLMKAGCDQLEISPIAADIRLGDARKLPLKDNSVNGIITSPPYSIALNYVTNDLHSLDYLGVDSRAATNDFVGVRGGSKRVKLYEEDMQNAYAEMARVLKPGRKAAIVLGDATVNGERIPTVQNCEQTFFDFGFKKLHKINKIIFGLYNVMRREDILIFEKPVGKHGQK